jgi:hypothetical protein
LGNRFIALYSIECATYPGQRIGQFLRKGISLNEFYILAQNTGAGTKGKFLNEASSFIYVSTKTSK